MRLSIIVAMAQDRAIGRNNQLLWHLSTDLKRFKALTMGHAILMGRKTYESLPHGALPNRRNIIISRQLVSLPNAEVYPSIEEALQTLSSLEEEVFVIGGGEIYQALLPQVQRIYLTCVEATFPDADTFFPELPPQMWEETLRIRNEADDVNEFASEFVILER